MLNIGTIFTAIRDKVRECLLEVEGIPESVQEVYTTAVDFFGEEAVDLQKIELGHRWIGSIHCSSTSTLLDLLGIPYELFPYQSLDISSVFQSESALESFLELITKERLAQGTIPLYTIIVHFHDITVSNEAEASTTIEDIYASTWVDSQGRHSQWLFWNRTTVSDIHYNAGYQHSHLPYGRGAQWARPCLGSGPIVMTMDTLKSSNDPSFWSLYWLELDKCIRVESIEGGPYFYIRDIVNHNRTRATYNNFQFGPVWVFTSYQLLINSILLKMLHSGKLLYVFNIHGLNIVNSFVDFTLLASNCALEYLQELHSTNEDQADSVVSCLITDRFLFKGAIRTDGTIVSYGRPAPPQSSDQETSAGFLFKGTLVPFRVVATAQDQGSEYFLLRPDFIGYLKNQLTILVNNIYAKK